MVPATIGRTLRVLLMADSLTPHSPRRDRDRQRHERRLRLTKATAGAVTGAVAVALVALVATDTIRLGGSNPRLAREASAASPLVVDPENPEQAETLAKLEPPRPLGHDAPLRLWVGGDSLAGWLGPSLGSMAGDTGVVATQIDYKVSSGIASDGVRDWPERALTEMAEYDPEAVVFMIGTNDASIVNHRLGEDGVYEWEPEYRLEVAEMMDLLVGGEKHRTVFWVGAPTMRTDWRDDGVEELNRVMQEEADLRDDVVFVDAYSLFAGADGQYVDSLTGPDGEYVRVRNGDGVHFTTEGGDRLASVVFALLDARWEITDQADEANPIEAEYSSGSGGYVSGGGGGRGTDSGGEYYPTETTTAEETTTSSATETTAPLATTTAPGATTTALEATTTVATTVPPTTSPPTTAPPAATTTAPPAATTTSAP